MATVFPDSRERDRIEAELRETCAYTKRQARILGTVDYPTKWDEGHHYLDLLLEDWEHAR